MPRRPKLPANPTSPDPSGDPGPAASSLVLYQTEDGATRVQVRLHERTVWMTQRTMAELYEVAVPTLNAHLSNLYEDREVIAEPTIRQFLIVQTEDY